MAHVRNDFIVDHVLIDQLTDHPRVPSVENAGNLLRILDVACVPADPTRPDGVRMRAALSRDASGSRRRRA